MEAYQRASTALGIYFMIPFASTSPGKLIMNKGRFEIVHEANVDIPINPQDLWEEYQQVYASSSEKVQLALKDFVDGLTSFFSPISSTDQD